jgi:hypothetical protein
VIDHGPRFCADKHHVMAGHVNEGLEWTDDVEHGELRIEHECNLHRDLTA